MKVVFACAGTGGHINPAIAMANLIVKKEPDSQILFIGTETGLENKLVANSNYNIKHIRTGKILRELTFKNITALINAYKGIGDAQKILKDFAPDIVIGTGGYICGPVMKAAKKLKIPYYLHESNAFPGVSVKLLAKDAKAVMIGFEDAKARLNPKANVVYTGTPAKFGEEDILNLDKETCKKELGYDNIKDKKIVLVTCGSQGAKRVNEVVLSMIKKYQDESICYILVTGDKNYDEVKALKEEAEKEIGRSLDDILRLEKFVFNMAAMYKIADMCITRAGAMTISELSLAHKPSVLIPLPYAAENHQFFNAKVLEGVDAAKIIEQKDLTEDTLNEAVKDILKEENLNRMSENASKVIVKDVEENIYSCIKMK